MLKSNITIEVVSVNFCMREYTEYCLEDLEVGMTASLKKTVTTEDVTLFAELTGDNNPIHIDPDYAAQSPFQAPIVHGMFGAALISAVAGTQLPGPGSIYMNQTMKFKAPIYINDTAEAVVTITEIDSKRGWVKCRTDIKVGAKLVTTGEATFKVNKRLAD